MNCPCCSGKSYSDCCEPFHIGKSTAPTAETLMRSRYAAFALVLEDYLWETTTPLARKFHPKQEYKSWAKSNQWQKLEIVNTPSFDQVEFKAYFVDEDGENQIHHELSKFERMDGKWYYASGTFLD